MADVSKPSSATVTSPTTSSRADAKPSQPKSAPAAVNSAKTTSSRQPTAPQSLPPSATGGGVGQDSTVPEESPQMFRDRNEHARVQKQRSVLVLNARAYQDKIESYDEFQQKMSKGDVDLDIPKVVVEETEPEPGERDDPHAYWIWLARIISEKYNDYEGFVVLQGIDTMCNTAAMLSFLIENLGKPVALTGAVSSPDASHSDWRRNFVLSVLYAGGYLPSSADTCEVVIVFAEQILRGVRAVLESTSSMQPFSSPKFPPLAVMQGHRLVIEPGRYRRAPTGPLTAHVDLELPEVLLLMVTPSVSAEALTSLVQNSRAKALVLLAYGAGNVPFVDQAVLNVAKLADAKGMVVVVQTQVRRGGVELGVYYTSGPIARVAISAGDMTVESTVAKLKYLLGRRKWTKSDVKALMQRNLRGELTATSGTPQLESSKL